MRLAIMQPYFVPYAGFFRLFDVDVFVELTDAQFPKGGWVNRNRATTLTGEEDWLTLPLAKAPLDTEIREIQFAPGAEALWEKQTRRFKAFNNRMVLNEGLRGKEKIYDTDTLAEDLRNITKFSKPGLAIGYALGRATRELKLINHAWEDSRLLGIPKDLKGQDRVLAICEHLKATEYINAPGGIALYDLEGFKRRGIKLKILAPYEGNMLSILDRLSFESPEEIRKEIDANAKFIS